MLRKGNRERERDALSEKANCLSIIPTKTNFFANQRFLSLKDFILNFLHESECVSSSFSSYLSSSLFLHDNSSLGRFGLSTIEALVDFISGDILKISDLGSLLTRVISLHLRLSAFKSITFSRIPANPCLIDRIFRITSWESHLICSEIKWILLSIQCTAGLPSPCHLQSIQVQLIKEAAFDLGK